MNRAFKVIQGHPYWCRQESRTVCCRNVQLINADVISETYEDMAMGKRQIRRFQRPHSSLKTTSKKRLRISTNDLYCQKLELLTYIFAADSMGLYSLVFA